MLIPANHKEIKKFNFFFRGFGGFGGLDGRKAARFTNNLIDQLFPNDRGGPSRPPRSDIHGSGGMGVPYGGGMGVPYGSGIGDIRGSTGGGGSIKGGSIGGGSIRGGSIGRASFGGGAKPDSGKGSISSLPVHRERAGSSHLIYRVSSLKTTHYFNKLPQLKAFAAILVVCIYKKKS